VSVRFSFLLCCSIHIFSRPRPLRLALTPTVPFLHSSRDVVPLHARLSAACLCTPRLPLLMPAGPWVRIERKARSKARRESEKVRCGWSCDRGRAHGGGYTLWKCRFTNIRFSCYTAVRYMDGLLVLVLVHDTQRERRHVIRTRILFTSQANLTPRYNPCVHSATHLAATTTASWG